MAFIRRIKTTSGATAIQIAHKSRGKVVRIEHIGSAHTNEDLETLLATGNYYKQVGYQGNILGYLLLKDVQSLTIHKIMPDGYRDLFSNRNKVLLPMYRWDIDTDTNVLNDRKELQAFFIELINEIYVGLNLTPVPDDLIKAYLKQEGWLVE